jgi:hypothetical protein
MESKSVNQPPPQVRDFIGDSGSTIRVQSLSELTPSDPERTITVSGARDQVLRAVALILNTVSEALRAAMRVEAPASVPREGPRGWLGRWLGWGDREGRHERAYAPDCGRKRGPLCHATSGAGGGWGQRELRASLVRLNPPCADPPSLVTPRAMAHQS